VGHGVPAESLQSRGIGAKAELTIAEGHHALHVVPSDIVPRYKGMTFNLAPLFCRP
jgi:hypothetical protein